MDRLTRVQFDTWAIIISVLAAGNGYFIKRLVDQQDDTRTQVYLLREDMATVKAHIKDLINLNPKWNR